MFFALPSHPCRPYHQREAIMAHILFDQGTPEPLRKHLPRHIVETAFEPGWSNLRNGELLARAETRFEVFVTTDKNLRYQQNLTSRKLAIVVLPFASWPRLQLRLIEIIQAIDSIQSGGFIEIASES